MVEPRFMEKIGSTGSSRGGEPRFRKEMEEKTENKSHECCDPKKRPTKFLRLGYKDNPEKRKTKKVKTTRAGKSSNDVFAAGLKKKRETQKPVECIGCAKDCFLCMIG